MHRRNVERIPHEKGLRRSLIQALCAGFLLSGASALNAEELIWRASTRKIEASAEPLVTLGRPLPERAPIIRAQGPEFGPLTPSTPPPPPPPGTASPFPGSGLPGAEGYNCGVANTAEGGGFFTRFWDGTKKCFGDVTGSVGGIFQPGPGRSMFQSDHAFDSFMISPVSNPYYFEDPRALTELRPIFIWQRTPGDNPIFAGGDNFFASLQARVAITERISLTINKMGFTWTEAEKPTPEIGTHFGFSELHLGPKFTIIRNDVSRTAAALGMVFELPIGGSDVLQNTGDLTLRPYFSIGQNFLRSNFGSFNFMNTTGYAFGTDNKRTDFLFSSFHLDYEISNKFFPFVELNWTHYTANGGVSTIGFEGSNLFNFGSDGVSGKDELTIAGGMRFKVSEAFQLGISGETNVLGGNDRRLDRFRLTVDVIFRY